MRNPDRARSYLTDEFFIELVEMKKKMYIDIILSSNEDDTLTREKALIKLNAIKEFVADIQSIADDKLIEKKRWKIL